MLYLAALGMVLAVMAATGVLAFALVVRPMQRRHELELAAREKSHAERLAAVAVEQMRCRGWNPTSLGAPTVRP